MRVREAAAIARALANGDEFHRLVILLQILEADLEGCRGAVSAHRKAPGGSVHIGNVGEMIAHEE